MTAVQRVLVTGAGGFVGRHIVQALMEAGHRVLALDRSFDDDIEQAWKTAASGTIELISSDVGDLPTLDVDAVIHGAAMTASPEEAGHTPEENYKANIGPALSVLDWSRRRGVRRTIVLSSGAVYRATLPGPVDETLPASPLGLYAAAKDATEKLVETLRNEYARDVVVVRLSNIYGPYERARATRPRVSLVARMVEVALDQGHVTVYRQDPALDWTYAPDIGRAIERILAAPTLRHHLYHVASEQMLTPLDIAQGIKAELPAVAVDAREGHDPEGRPRTRLGYLSSERLRTELGFDQWTAFRDGLQTVIMRQKTDTMQ